MSHDADAPDLPPPGPGTGRALTFDRTTLPRVVMDVATLRFIECNPAAVAVYGHADAAETLGLTPVDVSAPVQYDGTPSAELVPELVARALEDGAVAFPWRHRRPDGSQWDAEVHLTHLATQERNVLLFTLIDITELRRVEAQVAQQRAELGRAAELERLLFDQTFQYLGLLDTDGRLRRANRTALEFIGISDERDVLGAFFWETPWWRHDAAMRDQVRAAIASAAQGKASRLQVSHTDAGGRLHHVDFSLKPLRDEHGNIIQLIAEGRDLTEQIAAVMAHREVEERFRALFVDMVEGCAIHHIVRDETGPVDYRLIDVNPGYEHILGLSRADVVGKLASVVYGQSPPPYLEEYSRVATTGVAEHLAVFFAPLGMHFSISISPLGRDAFATIFSDVTEEKRVQEALEMSEARLWANLENTPAVAVQWFDQEGRIRYWNHASEVLYGWRADEVLGKTLDTCLYSADDAADFLRILEGVRATGHPYGPYESGIRRKDGSEGWVLATTFAMPAYEDGVGFVCMDVDITARKRAEEEREKLQAQLLQSQKMEAIGRLAGGVAHDFNNLLGVIIGQTDLLLAQARGSEPLRAGLKMVQQAAQRSADLTRQLLAFARKQTISPRPLDLNAAIAGTLEMIRRLIGEHITLRWRPGASLAAVRIDPSQIDQLLANLCVNARDAIGGGAGEITIETANAHLDAAYCAEHPESEPGDYVMIAVRDSGGGMTEEVMGRMFEPFFTTKGVGEGSGLGLAMVYGVVHQNGGSIHVTSEPGRGTTVRLYLPRIAEPAIHSTAPQTAPVQPSRRGTVLLVEDEPALRRIGKAMLERIGFTVVSAELPSVAIELCRTHPDEIALLITDVIMPEMTGGALRDRLREIRPGLRCLYMSGYTADVIADHGVLAADVHFLQKPFTLASLDMKVREALEG